MSTSPLVPVFDGHNDTLTHIRGLPFQEARSFLERSDRGHIDQQLDAIKASAGMMGINFHTGFLRADVRTEEPTSLTEIVRHARYVADRIGVEHVGLGSDFDGAHMPDDLADVTALPRLVQALRDGGFSEADVRRIAHENWVRVIEATWMP